MDLLNDVVDVVRTAITQGLLPSTTITEFDHAMATMNLADTEDYLQELWDKI